MLAWEVSGDKAVFLTKADTGPWIGFFGIWPSWYLGPKTATIYMPSPKVGPMISMLIRPNTGDDCYAYQKLPSPRDFRGKTVEFYGWVLTSLANKVRLGINDGITPVYSSYHTGSKQWEKLKATCTIDQSATSLQVELHLKDNGSPPAYFDDMRFEVTSYTVTDYGYTRYNAYEIVEKLVKAIGGTLTYESRSSEIMSLYPNLEVQAGETAASVLQKVLQLVPDKIKFFGNDAVLYYPQTTDNPVYYFKGPE